MSLSASQARLLSLTARQSNLEYEGQQINQQRTTLSNESSNYYNSLLEMEVPVPPSSNDYTKIVYSFTIGGNKATIDETLPQEDGNGNTTYIVSYTTELSTIGVQENTSYKTAASAKKTEGAVKEYNGSFDEKDTYYLSTMNRVSQDELSELKKTAGTQGYVLGDAGNANDANTIIIGKDGYQISKDQYNNYDKIADADKIKACSFYIPDDGKDVNKQRYVLSYAQIPNEKTFNEYKNDNTNKHKSMIFRYEEGKNKGFYSYKASSGNDYTVVDSKYEEAFINAGLNNNDYYQYEASSGIRFVKREDVEGNLNNQSRTITTFAVSTIDVTKKNTLSGATVEFDSSGRISSITDEEGNTYTMTASTETDNQAYDDAYNQYEYNQYVYDQKQTEINANIEILQARDKSLELRLSTLDTQHSAIQTELEAVKKVMSKNIDNSFKSFNA